jgi:hypothetical protein
MYKTDPLLVEKCRTLRRRGFTLGEIIKAVKLPKTTVYDHIRDILLPAEIKKQIQEKHTKRINEFNRKRKGKCLFGRIVPKPKGWTNELLFLIAHFMFDGEIQTHSCIYHNRNIALIDQVKSLMDKIFNLQPRKLFNKKTGVHRISYHYVELADYMRKKSEELKNYIMTAPLLEKKIFLRTFFDDEGCVGWWGKKKLVRGFQHNLEILKIVQNLLKDFNIQSKIDEKYKEIVISRKPNLIKFRDKINFSKGVYINPDRKNSIWKKKFEKREILNHIISSYKK